MAKLIKQISVFFPAYNLEKQIEKTIRKAFEVVPKIAEKYEITVINDGSRDRTGEVLEKLGKEHRELKVITHEVNKGYGGALKSGFYNAKYPWIVLMDADGQFDITELTNFIKTQKETKADLVIGYYFDRKVSTYKKVTSRIWELFVFLLFGLHVKDIDCGFKLVSKKVIDVIPKLESERGAFISSELLLKAQKEGFKIVEVGVTHLPRTGSKGTGRDLNVIIKSFIDLFRLWSKSK